MRWSTEAFGVSIASRAELELRCGVASNGIREHSSQTIRRLPEAAFLASQIASASGSGRTIMLAVDALRFDTAGDVWSPDVLIPLTTTFPSTSVVAWRSALSGCTVDEHDVPGVVYYIAEEDVLFHCFRDRALATSCKFDGGEIRRTFELRAVRTMFERLAARGVRCIANVGDLVNWDGRWSRALVRGAHWNEPLLQWEEIRFSPAEIVAWAIADIERALASESSAESLLIWTWLNFDEYVHFHGYSEELCLQLRVLESGIRRWVADGHVVIAHSDHGMVPNISPPELLQGWAELSSDRYCRLPAGGAGRVRWLYPRPGMHSRVHQMLSSLCGDSALITTRDDLAALGLIGPRIAASGHLGEIQLIATSTVFPVPDPSYVYEHGSFTSDEMIVPFAWWGPH